MMRKNDTIPPTITPVEAPDPLFELLALVAFSVGTGDMNGRDTSRYMAEHLCNVTACSHNY